MMNDHAYEQMPEIKSLVWLTYQFPFVPEPKDDSDKMQNCIHIYCAKAVERLKYQMAENIRLLERNNELAEKGERVVVAYKRAKEDVITAFVQALLDAFPESNRDAKCLAIYYDDFVELVESVAEELKDAGK